MTRERIAAVLLCAYPADRRERGAEMLSTFLDASAGSKARFARESVDLLRLGLRARATRVAGRGVRRLIADGACVGGAFLLAQELATALRSRGVPHPLYSPVSIVVLSILLVCALAGHDRAAGLLALAWFALRAVGVTAGIEVAAYPSVVLPVFCFAVMVVSPRRGSSRWFPSDRYGSEWLVVLVVLVVLAGAFGDVCAVLALVAATLFAATAAALLTTDPRPAIAVALVAASLGVTGAGSDRSMLVIITLVGAAPLVLSTTVARTRQLIGVGQFIE